MEIFKTFGTKLEIHQTRAFIPSVSYEEATQAAQQLEWRQFHIIKHGDGTVDASFIISREVSDELWKFIGGESPDPQLA